MQGIPDIGRINLEEPAELPAPVTNSHGNIIAVRTGAVSSSKKFKYNWHGVQCKRAPSPAVVLLLQLLGKSV